MSQARLPGAAGAAGSSRSPWRTKSIAALQREAAAGSGLARALGAADLIVLGIGGVVGTGVFVLTGRAAAANAGPAVALSFVISAFAAGLAGLCYAEMASLLPLAGSAYTYAYATLGELLAFMIGWNLLLEYGVAASTVSVGWSGYACAFVRQVLHVEVPSAWSEAPLAFDPAAGAVVLTGAWFNVPAALVLLLVTWTTARGVRHSLRFTTLVVLIKLAVILLFVVAAAPAVDAANWVPFVPPNAGRFGRFGASGVLQAATMLFFAYCGFDAISTAAQECRRPQRDLPLAMIVSLSVATLLYVAVALVLTGVVPYAALSVPHPLAVGIAAIGKPWLTAAVDVGAIAGLTSVLLVQIYGQTRILLAMAADGLLPAGLARLDPRRQTPRRLTWIVGGVAAVGGGLLPIDILGELTSSGTLLAFALVSVGVTVLRRRHPELPRGFAVPLGPYVLPLASAATSVGLLVTATGQTLWRLLAWTLVGLLVYVGYSRRHALGAAT